MSGPTLPPSSLRQLQQQQIYQQVQQHASLSAPHPAHMIQNVNPEDVRLQVLQPGANQGIQKWQGVISGTAPNQQASFIPGVASQSLPRKMLSQQPPSGIVNQLPFQHNSQIAMQQQPQPLSFDPSRAMARQSMGNSGPDAQRRFFPEPAADRSGIQIAGFLLSVAASRIAASNRKERVSPPVVEALGQIVDLLCENIAQGANQYAEARSSVESSETKITEADIKRYIQVHLSSTKASTRSGEESSSAR